MVIYLTLPPLQIPYPYIAINTNKLAVGLNYIRIHGKRLRLVLIDSGIEVFRDCRIKDYPGGITKKIEQQVEIYDLVRSLVSPTTEVYVTCPDLPDDYCPGALWLSPSYTNIERTVDAFKICMEDYPDVNWLVSVQGHFNDYQSLIKTLRLYEEIGVLDRYDYYAVANICTVRKAKPQVEAIKTVHRFFEEKGRRARLHVFGMRIRTIPYVKDILYSFNSVTYTKPINKALRDRYPHSAKNTYQRILFFCCFMENLRRRYGLEYPEETKEACYLVAEKEIKELCT